MPDILLKVTTDAGGTIKAFEQIAGGLEGVDRSAKKAQGSVDEIGKKMKSAFGPLSDYSEKLLGLSSPALAAAAGFGALTAAGVGFSKAIGTATAEAIAYGGKLADLSTKLGTTASWLQKVEHGGRLTGASTEQLSGAVTRMQKALVDGSKAFDTLGLSQQRLRAQKPEAAFSEIARAIKGIEDPAEQAAVAMQLFGKAGAELLPTLKSNLEDAALQAEHLGLVLSDDTVAALDAVGDSVDTMGATWDAAWRNVGATLAKQPEFIAALQGITEALGAIARNAPAATQGVVAYFAAIDRFMLGGNVQQLLALMGAMGRLSGAAPAIKTPMFGPMEAPGGPKLPSAAAAIELATKNTREWEKAVAKVKDLAVQLNTVLGQMALESARVALEFKQIAATAGVGGTLLRSNPLPGETAGTSGLPDTPGAHLTGLQAFEAWRSKYGAANDAFLKSSGHLSTLKTKTVDWNKALGQALQTAAQIAQILGLNAGGGKGTAIGATLGGAGGSAAGFAIGGPAGAAIGGAIGSLLGGLVGGLFGRGARKRAEHEKQGQELLGQFDSLFKKIEQMQRDFARAGAESWSRYTEEALKATDLTEDRLERLARMGVASFAAMRKAGFGFLESIRAMSAGLLALQKRADELGLTLGESFRSLSDTAEWAEAHAGAIQMAEDLAKWIDALRAMGLVTADVLRDLAAETLGLFKQLGGDIDDLTSGVSQRALAVLAPSLFKLRQEAERLGIVLDADTMKLIEAAEKGGLFAGLEDPMEKLNEQFDIMIQLLAEMVRHFGVLLPDAVQAYIDKLNRIPAPPTPTGGTGNGGGDDNRRRDDDTGDYTKYASGAVNAFFPARRGGHWLNVAEGGRGEYVTVTHGPVAMLSKHGLISSTRVPAGVTHAAEGLYNVADVLGITGGGGGASFADVIRAGGGSGDGGASGELQSAVAALIGAAEAAAQQKPSIVNVSFTPQLNVQETSLARTRESNAQFDDILATRASRLLRNSNNELRRTLERILDDRDRRSR